MPVFLQGLTQGKFQKGLEGEQGQDSRGPALPSQQCELGDLIDHQDLR